MQQRPLTRYRLQKIINTREADFSATDPPPSLKSLEEYAEGTASQLLQLQVGSRVGLALFHFLSSWLGRTAPHMHACKHPPP